MADEVAEVDVLKRLSDKFASSDLEWRVMRARPSTRHPSGLCVEVLPYVTARAVHQRLDDVVGPGNWCNTQQVVTNVAQDKNGRPVVSVQVGISIRVNGEWVTKYNVSEATDIEAAKGAFSGAEKRAGSEWGIGRYLYFLDQQEAENTFEYKMSGTGWNWASANIDGQKKSYWWKPPVLPAWALPPGEEPEVTAKDLTEIKKMWMKKMSPYEKDRAAIAEKFQTMLMGLFKMIPPDHETGWTYRMIQEVKQKIESTKDPRGVDPSVPFE